MTLRHLSKRPHLFLRIVALLVAATQTIAPVWATCGGGGGGGSGGIGGASGPVYVVPWKVLKPGETVAKRGWALYWFPASPNEVKNSSLKSSRDLTLYAAQGVAMIVADSSYEIAKKLDPATIKPPFAILVDNVSGDILARADGTGGMLKAPVVEKMVATELKKVETKLAALTKDAAAKVKAKDNPGAIDCYNQIWAQRALFPKQAKAAQAALKKLGVTVDDKLAMLDTIGDPIFTGAKAAKVVALMDQALAAERAGDYVTADRLYTQAHEIDPADPTPSRYLAESLRHNTGEWKTARAIFEDLLKHPADPLTRAVALHGLGKMTIHEGEFLKGMHLMEDSVAEFPLPLAYRNLAVYWNSEGDAAKTAAYVDLALKLDPEDAYNVTFAAVFMSAAGRKDEALRIAKENESLMPASYNLAAIYAQAGDRDKALEFLKRHFYEYERFGAVRAEEMMEARVDEVFASIRSDPEFLKLTSLADGMLPMKMTAH